MKTFLFLLCIAVMGNGRAFAAMFGDFAVPDALSPRVVAAQENGATAVAVPLASGSELTLFIPARNGAVRERRTLEYIGQNLNASIELALLNVGGRLWIGNRTRLSGADLYWGHTYKNGVAYPFSFSVDSAAAPSTEARQALARIGIFPDLADSGAAGAVLSAMELLDAGETPEALETLARAESMLRSPDDPGRRYVELSLAYAHEAKGENQEAMERFAKAYAAFPGDVEAATRYFGTSGILSEGAAAVKALLDAAAENPDEPEFLETLGSLYLAYDDMESATAYFEEALDLNPTSGTALLNLAHLYERKADYENSYRHVVALRYYHPYIPDESLPNLSGKLAEERMRELAGEPLTLGALIAYLRIPDAPAFAPSADAFPGGTQTVAEGPGVIIVEQPPEIIVVQNPVTVIQPVVEVYIPQPYIEYYDSWWWYSWSWWRPSRDWRRGDWDRWYSRRPVWRPRHDSRPPPGYYSAEGRGRDRRDRSGDRRDAAWGSGSDSSSRRGYRASGGTGTGIDRAGRDGTASPGRNSASMDRATDTVGRDQSALPSRSPRRRGSEVENVVSTGRRNGAPSDRTTSSGGRQEVTAATTAAAEPSASSGVVPAPSQRRVARPGTGQTRFEDRRESGRESAPMRTAPSGTQRSAGGAGVVQPSGRTQNADGQTRARPAQSANRTAPQSGGAQASVATSTQRLESQRTQQSQPRANQSGVRQSVQQPRRENAAPPQSSRQVQRTNQPNVRQPVQQSRSANVAPPQSSRQAQRTSQPNVRQQPAQQSRSANVAPPQSSRQSSGANRQARSSSSRIESGGRQASPGKQPASRTGDDGGRRKGKGR